MKTIRLKLAAFLSLAVLSAAALLFLRPSDSDHQQFPNGLPDDFIQVAVAVQSQYPQSFQDASGLTDEQSEANRTRNVRLWGPGLHINAGPQQVGDCVSWGWSNAIKVSRWVSSGGKANEDVSTLYTYGITRVNIGRHKPPCKSDGAYPSFAAQGAEQLGFLFVGEAGLPTYSGTNARKFGCDGPSVAQVQEGRKRAGVLCQPIPTVIALRNAICAGYPCPSAFTWNPGKTYTADGRRCIRFNGKSMGGHQTCIIGYDGSTPNGPWFYLQNSHGENWPANSRPLQGEPAGGVWVHQSEMERLVDSGEFWAVTSTGAFEPDPLDLSIFDLN